MNQFQTAATIIRNTSQKPSSVQILHQERIYIRAWMYRNHQWILFQSVKLTILKRVILAECLRKQHRRVTIPACCEALARKHCKGLPAVDYGFGRGMNENSERSQPDKERPVNYTQVKYTCYRAQILKLMLSVMELAEVTMVLQ